MNRLFPALAAISHRTVGVTRTREVHTHVGALAARNTTFPVSTKCHTTRSKQHTNCTEVEVATGPMMKHARAVSITTRQWRHPLRQKMHKTQAHQCLRCLTMGARVLWHVTGSTREVTAWPFLPYFEVRILFAGEDFIRHEGDCCEVMKADGATARHLQEAT